MRWPSGPLIPFKRLRGTPRGQPASELTKLKAMWQKLGDGTRAEWLKIFRLPLTLPRIRVLLYDEFNLALDHDHQVTRFIRWAEAQEPLY